MKQQCSGITKSGERCKITGNLTNGYCYRHQPGKTASVAPESPPKVEKEPVAPQPTEAPRRSSPEPEVSNFLPLVGIACLLLFVLFLAINGKRKAEFIRLR